ARIVAGSKAKRLRPGVRWLHGFGEGGGRGADEPARGVNVQRASPLADEVRRWLEARGPGHAAARKECDLLVAQVPGRGFRDVPGVSVLGCEHDERAAELLVERRDDERQRGLGDAGAGIGQFLEERAEALAGGGLP